jgi:hypothetical protein
MPSLPAETYEKIFSVLEKLPIFDDNRKLKKERDIVWDKALAELTKIKKHNLYLYVQKNRHCIQTNLRRHNGITDYTETIKELNQNSDNEVLINTFQVLDDFLSMKNCPSLNSTIKNICSRPFYVLYSSTEQISLWHDLLKYGCSTVYFLIIDVSLQNVKIGNNIDPQKVYLYALGTEVNEETVLLFQFIGEVVSEQIIDFLLRECLRHDVLHLNLQFLYVQMLPI